MVESNKNEMEQLKKIFFLGTVNAQYHPMEGIDERLTELLTDFKVTAFRDSKVLEPSKLKDCTVFILYREFNLPALTEDETAALLTYVAEGGALFVLHNGISVQGKSELSQLIGAKFTGHPPYDTLPEIFYHREQPSHPIFTGVSDFKMYDEAYQFEMDSFADKEILLSYDFEGSRVPAGWVRGYGKGRMLYLCCGHNKECFFNTEFSRI
ncbi:MAG: ThuA protein, partial [Herbinix sp.]|nr:ThuA protein [Herbinix sp.]